MDIKLDAEPEAIVTRALAEGPWESPADFIEHLLALHEHERWSNANREYIDAKLREAESSPVEPMPEDKDEWIAAIKARAEARRASA